MKVIEGGFVRQPAGSSLGLREVTELDSNARFEQQREVLADLLGQNSDNAGIHPLSFAQQRLWFLEQFEPGTALHNLSTGLRLYGALDIQALQRAVDEIVARHEVLRTTFTEIGGEVFQRVSHDISITIPVVDLRRAPEHLREREAYNCAHSEWRHPFDLQSGLLFRIKIVRIKDDDHILLLTMHHLVSDGWSVAVFVQELTRLYTAHVENRPCVLPPLLIQYSDYARWQRDSLPVRERERQLRYWKAKLAGMPSLLDLPSDRVRPSEQTFSGATCSAMLSSLLCERLASLAQREELTLFMVLLASFSVLLHRYSDQEDICIGVPVAGRELMETEPLIGLFVNALVIRTHLSANPRFRDVLAQTRDVLLEAYANQEAPFEKVVEELQPQRSLAYNPLFQVMMTMFQAPRCEEGFGALTATPYVIGTSTSRFDLTLSVVEAANGTVWLQFEYKTGLFDEGRISRMMDHYQTLLTSVAGNPDQRIGDLELLTAKEHSQVATWNNTAVNYPEICVHDLIARQAVYAPDRVAVTCGSGQLTYAALSTQAMRIASALSAAGESSGSHVGICLERSAEMVAGLLGILHVGAAYVPMDPSHPVQRLSSIVQDAGVSTVLTSREIAARLPAAVRQIYIEDALKASASTWRPSPGDPEGLCYVIYTSGSTGTPKGVCVSHRAVTNVLHSMRREPGFTASDKLLAVTPLTFDISVVELFLPLICGAQIVVANRAEAFDGTKLLELVRLHGITVLQATPSTWRLLIEAGWSRGIPGIRVLCGGEALTGDFGQELLRRSHEVWNLYGPTETTIWSSVSRVKEGHPVSLGRPIANTEFYVLDRRLQHVPAGVIGELYIGGKGLAKGYWRRADLTREKFVPCPFQTGERLYRTGDRVRYNSNGEIEYLGRLDFQVKIHGRRIELGEIETALCACPGVRQAVTIVREDTPNDRQLVAYIVPERGKALLSSSLRTALKSRLPDYLIPQIVFLDAVPVTAHGKTDRTRLPPPRHEALIGKRACSPLERQLLAIWEHVLRVTGIGPTDNFYEVGGHSLLAIRLLADIEKAFGKRLPISTFLKSQTVEEMAAVLGGDLSPPTGSLQKMQPMGQRPPLFLFPGAGGDLLGYGELPRLLDSDQPVYGLASVGLDGNEKPLERIEDIAERFLAEIRRLQPSGPYQLAGFCIGGITAFEVAQQLIAKNEEVSLLALIETWPPTWVPVLHDTPTTRPRLASRMFAVPRHLGIILGLPPSQAVRYFREKITMIRNLVFARQIDSRDPSAHRSELVMRANHRAAARYIPSRYPGHILLFIPAEGDVEHDRDPRLVWGAFAEGGCTVINITGNRGNLLSRPHVQTLASYLTEQLHQSQSRVAAAAG